MGYGGSSTKFEASSRRRTPDLRAFGNMGVPSDESVAPTNLVELVQRGMDEAAEKEALFLTADPVHHEGRHLRIGGRRLLNFGSTSYLSLDRASELANGAIEAIRTFGSQFPFPRAFVQCPLYVELEEALGRLSGGHAVVAPSTTLAHQAALPALLGEGDTLLLGRHAHPSLHTAAALLRDVPMELVDEQDLSVVENRVRDLGRDRRRVWFALDGLASSDGRIAPFGDLKQLQRRYSFLHLYVDEAHNTSWCGTHGRGRALEELEDRSRLISVLSLNKAFAAAGAALILPSHELASRIRRTGGPLVFSGPLQPALLGAALASARLHLTSKLVELQERLAERIRKTVAAADIKHVPLSDRTESPLFFVHCGSTETVYQVVSELSNRDVCVCPVVFPMVESDRAGLRFTISLHNQPEDIEHLMSMLAEVL